MMVENFLEIVSLPKTDMRKQDTKLLIRYFGRGVFSGIYL